MTMAIAMMKPIMPIVFMMEVTVVEGVSTLTNAHIVCVTMEEQPELIHHVSANTDHCSNCVCYAESPIDPYCK